MTKEKPVAWIHFFKDGGFQITPHKKYPKDQALYTDVRQKKWIGLTEHEFSQIYTAWRQTEESFWDLYQHIEDDLRKKNADQ